MIRRAIATTAVLALAVVPVAFGRATKTVELGDNFFDPTSLKVKKDARVAFEWTGNEEHNVTKAKGPGPFFESETTSQQGVNFKHRFKKKGAYKLICTLHGEMRMKIEVK